MTQELIDLRQSILEGRYEDALEIVDELEGMSKQAILRNIQSFLLRLLTHLIKNQVEKRLTNSWATSISDSIRQIKKLNLKDHKTSYYLKLNEWQELIEDEIEAAIDVASVEVFAGTYSRFQLAAMVDKERVREIAQDLLALTYSNSVKELSPIVNDYLTSLPGGEEWNQGGIK
ncbi:MAG: DUF29 family protein [Oscillatoria sp. PMC 1068.18]|nr:DUF29 family protein [Oscillatoria sp. PMC 1076.18]MEC4989016.1 DUF29 family protein [Oscillatoria sp. PMC 1068.18]